ncbi:MAG: 50S ribosomal protein L1 [Elusimicrobia bacterium CG08_land_8_20_14_0_20_44_26]|nr:MAG: 50S ribosomal protein L1 [Elusimicrobia bacterium CG08_land_8_20_14_0_20_44_26]
MKNKRYEESKKLLKKEAVYSLDEGIKTLKSFKRAKFDETVEMHIRLNTGSKKIPQNINGSVALPAGTGKKIRVAVLAKGDKAKEAASSGADRIGFEDIISEVQEGKITFDVLLATPDCMKDVSKIARILGPRGLMPTPKAGTVTFEIKEAVKNFKAGILRWKIDSSGNIHAGVGKISFSDEDLVKNINALADSVKSAKLPFPAGPSVIRKVTLATTMSPGIAVSV